MLRYVIPPIIIVTCSAILTVFFFKKFSNETGLNREVLESLNGNGPRNGVWEKVSKAFSHFWLKVLEKMIQRLKLFSLRIHNLSNSWFHSVKSKREKKVLMADESNEVEKKIEKEATIKDATDLKGEPVSGHGLPVDRNKRFFKLGKPSTDGISEMKNRLSMKRKALFGGQEKKDEKVPEKIVEKAGMEDELIKRIALNPKDIEAYERLGDYYFEMKNIRDSIECYKQVIKLSPDNGKARMKIKNLEVLLKR